MDRRTFLASVGATLFAASVDRTRAFDAVGSPPQVAITIDDPDSNADDTPLVSLDERNERILAALRGADDVKAALFVCGMRVDSKSGRRHLGAWNDAGHLLGNHSYSHHYYPGTPFDTFAADVLRGEEVVRDHSRFQKLFRFPYLKEGKTPEQRDRMRALLKEHGYKNGAVTIDASDWAIDGRLRKRLAKDPKADLAPYRAFYLEHIAARAAFYDDLAKRAVGRSVRHTLLLHHNLLNALFLSDLLRDFSARGWKLVDASNAFADPVFDAAPMIAPAGESQVWAIAKESGRFESELRYPAEDEPYEAPRMDEIGL